MSKARDRKKAGGKGRAKTGAATAKRAPAKKKSSAEGKARSPSVRVGLHGLGQILKEIHGAGGDLHERFEAHMGSSNLMVTLHPETVAKIRTFAEQNLADRSFWRDRNNDNCDPATDPWCIGF
jgi:hypothetical protein